METDIVSTNGHAVASGSCVTCPQRQADVDDLYRQGTELHRDKRLWQTVAVVLCGGLVCALGFAGYLLLTHEGSVEKVQVVQVDEAGKVQLLGVPVDLMQYQPGDGQWMPMIVEWITRVRKRGLPAWQSEQDWYWAKLHTCKPAIEFLDTYERDQEPHKAEGRLTTTVEVESIVRSDVPKSYTVTWIETRRAGAGLDPQRWTATVTTGRVTVTKPALRLQNPLGLCITHYNWSPHGQNR